MTIRKINVPSANPFWNWSLEWLTIFGAVFERFLNYNHLCKSATCFDKVWRLIYPSFYIYTTLYTYELIKWYPVGDLFTHTFWSILTLFEEYFWCFDFYYEPEMYTFLNYIFNNIISIWKVTFLLMNILIYQIFQLSHLQVWFWRMPNWSNSHTKILGQYKH